MPIAAGKLRVLIATTNGPVEVLLLTEEDAAIGRCVACIGGTTETADIAGAYHAFVVRPTGIIEARFGHSCYRLDVSARIDAGSSWQLGVLAAHALLANRRLAQENDTADAVLWATGSVRPVDLTVGAVSHVPEKLANSLDRLKQERAAGRQVLVALPAGNASEVPPTIASELAALGIETIALAHVQPLFDALAMQLPGGAGKTPATATPATAPVPSPAANPPAAPVATAPRRRLIFGAIAASALLAVAATGAVLLKHKGESDTTSRQQLASAPTSPVTPPASPPVHVALVPDQVPFVTQEDRAHIRDEYMTAPDYKALATNFTQMAFVSGQPSQEAADRAAMVACDNIKSTSGNKGDRVCDLYASGNVVVTRRSRPPMPPEPWLVRNPAIERPFVAAQVPIDNAPFKELISKGYLRRSRVKALVISPNDHAAFTVAQSSLDDAIRRSLERCGYLAAHACMVVAVDDTFVIPIPTLAKVVGFYRPDALVGVQPDARDEVARRLAAAPNSWNAVAVGADGHVGIAVSADSERSAFDGAMKDCAQHDRNCRIAVLGPFLVEATGAGQNQVQAQNQAPSQPGGENAPSPQPGPAPAASPAATPDQNQAQAPNRNQTPSQTAEPHASPSPQPAAPPAAATATTPQNQSPVPSQTAEQNTSPQSSPAPAPPPAVTLNQNQTHAQNQTPNQIAEQHAAPSPLPAPAPAAPARAALVPDRVPLITTRDQARIRDEYMKAPGYKALATSLMRIAFVSGQPSQEIANRAAMEACEKLNPNSLNKADNACELYASGTVVVTLRSPPPMPPEPWLARNPAVEQPFVAANVPLISAAYKERINTGYPRLPGSKALVISPNGEWVFSAGDSSPDEAVRRGLERCGRLNSTACMVVAVDNAFVIPIPTLTKAVGFYRPEGLSGVQPQARDEVTRRLAGAPNAWNAVAVGTDGNVGIAVGARSEQSALDGALADCARHDRNCRIAVLGPFLVEAASPGQIQVQVQNQDPPQVQGEEESAMPAPPPATAPAMPTAAPARVALVPDRVPFVSEQDRARIRDEYMRAPDHKALAMSLLNIAFVSGQPTQDAADRAAMVACQRLNADAASKPDRVCDLYAAGNIVVSRHGPPPLPPAPWIVRNPAVERPFVASLTPLAHQHERLASRYARMAGPKTLVLSAQGHWSSSRAPSPDEAVRRSLERCGFLTSTACMVIAIDNTFVIPIPTLAKAVDFYRPEAVSGVQPRARDEVARRLAAAPNAWNAVAAGANGNVGIATSAASEQSAINGALTDCARHDRNCRIVVLGPFLVEMAQAQAQPQRPGQMQPPARNQMGYPRTGRTEYQKDAGTP